MPSLNKHLLIIFTLVSVLLFANHFIFQIICFYYPLYELQLIIQKKNHQRKIVSISKYFIIYGCLDVVSLLSSIFGIQFYRFQIIIMFCLFQINKYKPEWITQIYRKLISWLSCLKK